MSAPPTNRRSIGYFSSRDDGTMPVTGEGWFLARDIPLGIMPLGYSKRESSFRIDLQPPDEQRAEWLTNFLHVGQFDRHSLEDAVVDFVETTANYFGYFGEVYFEIAADADGQPARLAALARGRVVLTPRKYLQVIPKPNRQYHDGRRYIAIPRADIWHLRLPADLGSPRSHRRLLHRLTSSSPLAASMAMLQGPGAKNTTGYDFVAHRDASERVQERAMRRWGSFFSRQSPVGASTEYFYIARRLAFHAAQARVREHIIAELNALLARLATGHAVVVTGIPTAREIDDTLGRMHAGSSASRKHSIEPASDRLATPHHSASSPSVIAEGPVSP